MVLLKPKSKFKIFRWLWGENFRIHLDDKGSYLWQLMDGSLSIEELAGRLQDRFSLEDSLERTERFLVSLYRAGFLEFHEADPEAGQNLK